jgi:hypothetical protein
MTHSQKLTGTSRAASAQTGRQHAFAGHPKFDELFKVALEKATINEPEYRDRTEEMATRKPKNKIFYGNDDMEAVTAYTHEDTRPSGMEMSRSHDSDSDFFDLLSDF